MHPELQALLDHQHGRFGRWQLRREAASDAWIRREYARGWLRREHDGVYVAGHRDPHPDGSRWAAVLTTRGTFLARASAAAAFGFVGWDPGYETVVRQGERHGGGGPCRIGSLEVVRTRRLLDEVTTLRGIPITTGARTLFDILPSLGDRHAERAFREALRLGVTDAHELRATAERHRGRPGSRRFGEYVARYAPLELDRMRSDAEALGFEILVAAGIPRPMVNIRIFGEEADLSWLPEGLIIELDGPSFHRDRAEDERKQQVWETGGLVVRRLPTDDVYHRPERLVQLATRELALLSARPRRDFDA